MRTQQIGTTALTSSRLSYGCMRISGTWDYAKITAAHIEAGEKACIAAYEAGYTLFDHADIYGATACEEIFGGVLKKVSGMRDGIVIATKCGIRFDPPHRYDFSAEHILRSCDLSLKRLGVDTIDIYQLHRPDLLMNALEVAEAFAKLHAAGKVRYFGVSNFTPSFVSLLESACPYPIAVNQVEIHLGRLECFYDGTLDQCLARSITPLSWSPLGGGLFGDGGAPGESNPRRSGLVDLLSVLDEIAADHGATRTAVSLAWLLKHPSGIIPIVGTTNPKRIQAATVADSLDLTREEWYRLLVAARMAPLP